MKLLLGSTSRIRHDLLRRLDVPFEVAAPDFDERALDAAFASSSDDAFALALARGKAESLAPRWPEHAVLAADQIAVLPGPPRTLLHKPGTVDGAEAQLVELAGRAHALTTGVVLRLPDGRSLEGSDRQVLHMRRFSREEAREYAARYAPVECVGAYRIEDAGIRLFERVEGNDFTGIMGLPLLLVCRLLRQAGILPRP